MTQSPANRPHSVSSFDNQLAEIRSIINEMSALALNALEGALEALARQDRARADEIVLSDCILDGREQALDRLVVQTITSQAPMAEDLRYLIVSIRIASMLERTGDQAKRIAKRVEALSPGKVGTHLDPVKAMRFDASQMIAQAIRSFNENSDTTASEVLEADAALNAKNRALVEYCCSQMESGRQDIELGVQLISIGKQLERVGDYATNIAKDVRYMITGELRPVMPK